MTAVLTEMSKLSDHWITVDSGPVLVINASLGNHFRVLLDQDSVLDPPYEPHSGQEIILRIEQDTVGGHALTVNPGSAFVPGNPTNIPSANTTLGSLVLNTSPGAVSVWRLLYDEERLAWDVTGVPDLSSVYATAAALAVVAANLATDVANLAALIASLGTMSTQNANNVAIAGGTIGSATAIDVTLAVNTSDVYKVDGVQVVSNQGAAVADTTGLLLDLSTQFNTLLARLRAHGIIAT